MGKACSSVLGSTKKSARTSSKWTSLATKPSHAVKQSKSSHLKCLAVRRLAVPLSEFLHASAEEPWVFLSSGTTRSFLMVCGSSRNSVLSVLHCSLWIQKTGIFGDFCCLLRGTSKGSVATATLTTVRCSPVPPCLSPLSLPFPVWAEQSRVCSV